jgi:Flp pilus assembly protein TadD
MDKYEEAFRALDKAIELNPDNINAWDDKVTGLRNLRRIKEADAVLGELKKRFPPSSRKMYP